MKHYSKIILTLAILAAALLLAPTAGQTAAFPDAPITLVMPWGAEGSTDIPFRALCEAVKKFLGQPIIVENRVGGKRGRGGKYHREEA